MNNIKKHKRLIAAIVVILLAVLVEIFANRSAWGHAYDLDITNHMYISESAGQEEYQVIFSAPKASTSSSREKISRLSDGHHPSSAT